MKITVSQYARSLYEAAFDKKDGELKDVLKNFMTLLIANRDTNKAEEILQEFNRIWDRENGELKVELTSARELSAGAKKEIVEFVKAKTKMEKIEFTEKIDAKVLGGFILRYGDKIIDGSLKTSLKTLQQEISN